MDFPSWFISRSTGRLPFMSRRVVGVSAAKPTVSTRAKSVLREVEKRMCDGHGFVAAAPEEGGDTRLLNFNVNVEIADGRQQKRTLNVSGHRGSAWRSKCSNCPGRCPYCEDADLVRASSAQYPHNI